MKKIVLCILLSAPILSSAQSGVISGIITYFLNDFKGRPDVGARVYVFHEKIVAPGIYEYSTLDTFKVVNNHRETEKIYKLVNEEMPEEEKEPMKKYGVNTEDDFQCLDKRAFAIISKIKTQAILKTRVDGNGNFNIRVPPGDYSILVISTHSRGLSRSEVMGKFHYARLKIQAGETADFIGNFEP